MSLDKELIYNIVSLYDVAILYSLCFMIILNFNIYLVTFLVFLILKDIPNLVTYNLKNYPSLNRYPEGATDCDLFGKGGDFSLRENSTKQQVMTSSFIFFYLCFEYNRVVKELGRPFHITLIVFAFLFFILVPYTRLQKQCNNPVQLGFAMITSFGWAALFYMLESSFLMNWDRYKKDKEVVYNWLLA